MRPPGSVLVLLSAVFLPTFATAETYRFRPIALTGDPVPGVPDAHFTWLGTAPMGPSDPFPLIDAQGNVSFAGGWINSFSPHGLFVSRQGSLETIVITGEAATGTGSTFFALPGIIPGPARVSGTQTSFDGGFMPPGQTFVEQGVWADRTGSRELILRQTDHPPGTPPGASFFQWFHTLVGAGHIVVNARYSVGSSSAINDHGFWRDATGTLEVIALARTQAPGVPAGVKFGNGTILNLPAFENWDLDQQGRITFNAMLMEGGAGDLNDEGIWSEGTSGLQLVVREGDTAPGMGHPNAKFLGNSGFRTFGHDDVIDVLRNESGHIAFGARIDVPGTNNKANAIYAVRGSALEMVTFGMPSGSTTQGEAAPGFPAGNSFKRFPLGARISESGELTFHATVGTLAGSILDEVSALFVERGGVIELVVRTGQQVAGLPAGVTYTFAFPLTYLDNGDVVFSGGFNNGGQGLFVVHPGGAVDHLLSTGSTIEVAAGDSRVVNEFSTPGQASDAGGIAVSINFQDGTDGILVVEPAGPVAVDPVVPNSHGLALAGANPFTAETGVAFELARPTRVRLAIHDPLGREVAVLLEGMREAGHHVARWRRTDDAGHRLGPGVYFATLQAGERRSTTKLVALE